MSDKKIEKLTKEQEAQIPIYLERYRAIGLSTTPCDRAKAEKAITESHAYMKLPAPKFIWADSPQAGAVIAAQLAKGSEDVTLEEVKAQIQMASSGSFDAYWVSFYAFIAEQLPVKTDNLINIVKDIVENCGVYWTFEDIVVCTEKPIAIHMNADKKLHNPNGLALEYKDGFGVFVLNGVRFPSMMAMAIEKASK
jgi:hypothetical protein